MNRSLRLLPLVALFTAAVARAADKDVPAAVVAGSTFSFADVDRAAADRLFRIRNDEYTARRQALEELAAQALVAREAAARGVTPEALTAAEVEAKTPDPTDAQTREFFEQNKGRTGDKPYEELVPVIKNFLRQQAMGLRRADYLRGLKAKYGMTVNLEVPRADVSASTAPSRGPKNAPVTLIEFSDFQCPFCAKAEESVRRLEALYGPSLRVVFRNFPLAMHKDAPRAAEAAACADSMGKFWPYHDLLYANQEKLSQEGLIDMAVKTGMSKTLFTACLASGRFADQWRQDADDGRRAGVNGTPTFFVNGRYLFGNVPFEGLVQAIDDELLRLGKPLPVPAEASRGKGKKK
jgi:protein-disulfide isomerase